MIIVSQEKHLLNYNNVIEICKTFGNEKDVSIIATTINDDIVLGEYETEERADEVLEEIIENIQCKSFVEMNTDRITSEVTGEIYRMPKE